MKKIRNEDIRTRAGAANVSEIIREAILICLGHVERKTWEDVAMRTCKTEVGGHRKMGRPKLRWSDVMWKYTKEKGVKIEVAHDQITWKMKTRCADLKEGKCRRRRRKEGSARAVVCCPIVGSPFYFSTHPCPPTSNIIDSCIRWRCLTSLQGGLPFRLHLFCGYSWTGKTYRIVTVINSNTSRTVVQLYSGIFEGSLFSRSL